MSKLTAVARARPGPVFVPADLLERRVVEELSRWPLCEGVRSITIAGEKQEWIVTDCDPGPSRVENCRTALAIIVPRMRTKYMPTRE